MTELELYKFCKGKEIDWRGEILYLWINFHQIEGFIELLGRDYFLEGGLDVNLQTDCICVDLTEICFAFDILPESIKDKESI